MSNENLKKAIEFAAANNPHAMKEVVTSILDQKLAVALENQSQEVAKTMFATEEN